MAKPIPGPWQVTDNHDVRDCSTPSRFVASVFGRGKEEEIATAHQIAAAPEMHAALVGLRSFMATDGMDWGDLYLDVCNAIDKAEGKEVSHGA